MPHIIKKWDFKKLVSGIAGLSLLINSLVSPIVIYSQEDAFSAAETVLADDTSPAPTEIPSPTPSEEAAPSPEPEPTLEVTPTPEVTPSPAEEITPTPEEEITPTPEETPSPTPEPTTEPEKIESGNNASSSAVESNSDETVDIPNEPTPTVMPIETEGGMLTAVIIEGTLASTISEFDFEYKEETSATLVTDKPDYAPTDTVVIFGTGFTPDKEYSLEITSETGNFKFSDTVTSDESGNLFYTYQLDGTFRPLYLVEVKNSEEVVASTTFTDDSPAFLPYSDSFGTSDSSTVTNWDEQNPAEILGSTSGEDTTRDGTSSNKFAKIGENGWIRRTVNATGLQSLQLKYYWKGDNDAESTDRGRVEYCSGATCTSGFNELTNHQLNNTSWSSQQTINLPSSLNNSSFRIRFRNDASQSDEYFRVDQVDVTGSTIAQPDLSATKSHTPGGNAMVAQPFTWTVRVQNSGTATASFSNTQEILKDERPSTGVTSYGSPSTVAGGGATGTVSCAQSGSPISRDLTCTANGTVTVPVGGYFDIFYAATPSSVGTLTNPRSSANCSTDRNGVITESNEGNNACSDSVSVSAATGSITIIKDAQPDDAQDFAFTTSGTGLSSFSLDDDANATLSNTKVFSGLSAGTYTVQETAQAGFDLTGNVSCSDPTSNSSINLGTRVATINLSASENVTCTFTNTKKGHLIVQKTTIPSGDQTVFTINATGSGTITGGGTGTVTDTSDKNYEVTAGTYSVAETVPDGWSETGDTCQNIVVAPGQTQNCLLTNTKKGHIIIDKVTNPGGNTQSFTFDPSWDDNFSLTDQDTPYDSGAIPQGTYSVSEAVPTGWDLTEATCSDQSDPSSIDLQPGETVTCTFTNTKRGHLIVEKVTLPEGDQTLFEITAEGDGTITGGGAGTVSTVASHDYEVTPGTYSVTETFPEGWDETGNTCEEIEVSAGQTETCQIENTKRGQVSVTKYHDRNANETQDDGEEELSEWEIDLSGDTQLTDEDGQVLFENLITGEYALSELIDESWFQSNVTCGENQLIDNDNEHSIFVNPGDEITCSIGNYQNGQISGTKWNDENANQQNDQEPALSDWTVFIDLNSNGLLDGKEDSVKTGQDGSYLLNELTPGTYRICEAQQSGWLETYPLNSELNDCHTITVSSGNEISEVNFGNQEILLSLVLGKTNNKGAGISAGDTVTYTLDLDNTANQDIHNLKVTDVLPGRFSYVNGSTLINGVAASDPGVSGGILTWDIGILAQGRSVTITYQASTKSDLVAATYTNLATCKGNGFSNLREQILGAIECDPAASSSVRVGAAANFGGSVESKVSVAGLVLGIATELPASGNKTSNLIFAGLALWLGIIFKLNSYLLNTNTSKKRKKYGKN